MNIVFIEYLQRHQVQGNIYLFIVDCRPLAYFYLINNALRITMWSASNRKCSTR